MKVMRTAALLLVVSSVSFGQSSRPLKVNLLTYFDKVPAPPATCREAHDKCDCNISGFEGTCKPDKIFRSLEEELIKLQSETIGPPEGPQGDLAKKMQDPEFQKKVKKMSNEEKMELAMQMQQGMMPTMKVESDDVIAALKASNDLVQAQSQEMVNMGKTLEAQQKKEDALRAKHQAVDDWMAAEIKKLPLISSGEMSEHDPKAVFAVIMNAHKKHITIVDEHLKVLAKEWADEKAKARKQYTPFQTSLEKIHYGDDAANSSSKPQLATGQVLMIGSIQALLSESKEAYNEAANRYERMLYYEKQNKQ